MLIRHSKASEFFPWLIRGKEEYYTDGSGWTVAIEDVISDGHKSLDPKYLSKKATSLRASLEKDDHYILGDIVRFIPEKTSSTGNEVKCDPKKLYQYIEIQDINAGDYHPKLLRGWQLPSRARHFAEPGDIYFGSIWGSVSKWCIMPNNIENVVVTNGCFRCRMKDENDDSLIDLLAYMTTESWAVQLRSMARGSDGLAEINIEDIGNVIIPKLTDEARESVRETVVALQNGRDSLKSQIAKLYTNGELGYEIPDSRPSHIVLV